MPEAYSKNVLCRFVDGVDGAGWSASFQNDGAGVYGVAFFMKASRLQPYAGKEPFGQCDTRNRRFSLGTTTNDAGNFFDT